MAKTCTICHARAKLRCDRCRNEYCQEHAVKCHSCGTITCIRDLGRSDTCPVCKRALGICPECLLDGRLVKTIERTGQCPVCGWLPQSVTGKE